MPELPEVEITARGIGPHIVGRVIRRVDVRNPNLRWRVPAVLQKLLVGNRIDRVTRRAKYLLLHTATGCVIMHLGMSGSLRVVPTTSPLHRHDHVIIEFDGRLSLRFRDPRRFGCMLWSQHPARHRLLKDLGPEPLSDAFDGDHLYKASRGRPGAVKTFLMNASVVSGIGNIYASEVLHAAGINPHRGANRIALERYRRLAGEIKRVLSRAIEAGGTTLRDFQSADGQPGYFRLSLRVYDREGEPCPRCRGAIRRVTIQQRSSFYCPRCQH